MKALLDRRKRVLEYVDQLLEERPNDEVFFPHFKCSGHKKTANAPRHAPNASDASILACLAGITSAHVGMNP